MSKSSMKTIYSCQKCGAQRLRWEGRCSDCGAWNSFVEEMARPSSSFSHFAVGSSGLGGGNGLEKEKGLGMGIKSGLDTGPGEARRSERFFTLSLDQRVEGVEHQRIDCGLGELNRVLGGGLVPGSFVLLGGAPGIGKSTLLLQMAGGLVERSSSLSVLYISGEESVDQTASRAQRLGISSNRVHIGCESNLLHILHMARSLRPHVLIVDSIQTLFLPSLEAAPGSVSQVRDCAGHLMGLAKMEGMTVILIGHITKEGHIAGPKVLEHMVDCVLSFEGDMSYQFRLLRSLKNRFGPTHELGVFQMDRLGLKEVANPSELFLEERGETLMGSAVFVSMEGSRPLLCEVQALTLSTPLPVPRRTSLGIDPQRLHMISAVLDRHLGLNFSQADIYINVVGGLRLVEPSSDLAVAAALLSMEAGRELGAKTIFFGELGLTGEIRGVPHPDLRLKEAMKLGFRHFVLPLSNKKHLKEGGLEGEIEGGDEGERKYKFSFLKNIRQFYHLLKH